MMATTLRLIAALYYKYPRLITRASVLKETFAPILISLGPDDFETPIPVPVQEATADEEVNCLDETQTPVTLTGIWFKVVGTGNPFRVDAPHDTWVPYAWVTILASERDEGDCSSLQCIWYRELRSWGTWHTTLNKVYYILVGYDDLQGIPLSVNVSLVISELERADQMVVIDEP